MTTTSTTVVNDFDFFVGSWDVVNRQRKEWLAGCDEWLEFPAVTTCQGRLFDGAANLDEITFPTRGFTGLTLRLYHPQTREWSLYWASSRDGQLLPPVTGRFHNGRGEFFGDDTHDGRPVRVRFIWSDITDTSARWEQAFSADGGQTWETNWIMEFTRRN